MKNRKTIKRYLKLLIEVADVDDIRDLKWWIYLSQEDQLKLWNLSIRIQNDLEEMDGALKTFDLKWEK